MKTLRCDNSNELIFAHLNINSIRRKFEFLSTQVKGNIDVLMVSETKIDNSFPVGHFVIDGNIATSVVVASCCTLEKIFFLTWLSKTKKITESFYVELNLSA